MEVFAIVCFVLIVGFAVAAFVALIVEDRL